MHQSTDILFHWLDNTAQLSQRVCMVLMAAHVSIRIEWLRVALRGDRSLWRNRFVAILFFGLFAIIGTHSGFLLDVHHVGRYIAWPSDLSDELKRFQAVIGFRDLMVLAAGLTCGPWVGLGTGLLAGWERYLLGGFAGSASALGTIVQGLFAGLALQWWPRGATRLRGAVFIAIMGTVIQKSISLFWVQPYKDALTLVSETAIPVLIVNTLGVLLFLFVMQDLERDQLKSQAQKAELRALNAQIEPHFMNGTINAIKVLISENPNTAENYVVKLARFLSDTRSNACANSISLKDEMNQVERYLDFQTLRFPEVFYFHCDIPSQLLSCQIPPRTLQTLAENALLHGMKARTGDLFITIHAKDNGNNFTVNITDNGGGISTQRLADLGKCVVESENGNGSALYHLQKSLKLAFLKQAKMIINSQEGQGTEVILTIPKRSIPW